MKTLKTVLAGVAGLAFCAAAQAYDGTNCKAAGNCWEPKPGYPDKLAGSKYDPKHDPAEINKNAEAVKAMEDRNSKRLAAAKKSGTFKFEVE